MSFNRLQSAISSLAHQRVFLYSFFSTGALASVILNALRNHSNFYSTAVYLAKSNGSVFVMANFGLLITVMVGRLLQNLAFGPLRPAEVERLYDRIWFFVTESLLAFTIFRDEFDFLFILMFGALLFTKCFHWLLSDRIEWMDQRPYPGPPLLFHLRINFLMAVLWLSDFLMFTLAIESILTTGVGGIVLFASEYAILLASLMNSAAKYFISVIEIRRASERGGEDAPPWENKSMYIFYIELATDFLKLVTYLTFFVLVLTFYGLPLNIVRDVYITARSFFMKFRDLLRYRTATRNMDERYPNATPEELGAMNDRTCIICREEMVAPNAASQTEANTPVNNEAQAQTTVPQVAQREGPNTTPKKLPCGHVFHFNCLRSWLERQQNCPTCRRSVMESAQTPVPQAPNPPNLFNNRQEPLNPPQPGGALQQQGGLQQPNGGVPGLGGIFRRIVDAAGVPPGAAAAPPANLPGPANPAFRPAGGPLPPTGGRGAGYPAQPNAPRQGPPAFPGFMLPGGQWQEWGRPIQQRQPEDRQNVNNGAAIATSSASNANVGNLPINTTSRTTTSSVSLNSMDSTPASLSAGTTGSQTSSDAREARALAALKRVSSSPSISAANTEPATRTSNEGTTDLKLGPDNPSKGENRASTSNHVPKRHLPPLIPLYDPATLKVVPRGTSSSTGYRRQADQTQTHTQQWYPQAGGGGAYNRNNNQPNFYPQTVPPSYQQNVMPQQATPHIGTAPQHYNTFSSSQFSAPRAGPSGSSVSGGLSSIIPAIPAEITDEQLARLDRITREAIDERLKILTSVNNSTHRLIEELLRVRSVLPDPPVPVSTTVTLSPGPEPSGSNLNTSSSNTPGIDSSATAQPAASTTPESSTSAVSPSVELQDSSTSSSELPVAPTEGSTS